MKVKSESEVAQLCPTLSDPMDCSLPGSSDHGIFQARVLEWVAIAFSDSIVNKAGMISDLYFSHHNLEVLCYCYKYIEYWSDYVPGRADKKRILEQRHAGLCMVVVVVQ